MAFWKRAAGAATATATIGAAAWSVATPAQPPRLYFKDNAANAALLEQCPLLEEPLQPPPYLRNPDMQMILHDRKKRWHSTEIVLDRQLLRHVDGGTTPWIG